MSRLMGYRMLPDVQAFFEREDVQTMMRALVTKYSDITAFGRDYPGVRDDCIWYRGQDDDVWWVDLASGIAVAQSSTDIGAMLAAGLLYADADGKPILPGALSVVTLDISYSPEPTRYVPPPTCGFCNDYFNSHDPKVAHAEYSAGIHKSCSGQLERREAVAARKRLMG